jgi:uncharacterized protein YcaQ
MTTLAQLRRHALARSLFPATTLARAIDKLGFVQADPIRAPARAQDLTLRQRVRGYRAGDLERRYPELAIEEDFYVNYGFVPRVLSELMQPRTPKKRWTRALARRAQELHAFIAQRGVVHPREVDAHFAHGTVRNYWGGQSNATTHLLDDMHYRGMLRVVRRESGVRLYALRPQGPAVASELEQDARIDRLIDVIVAKYAPLPAPSLSALLGRMRYATPQWSARLKAAVARAKQRLQQAQVGGIVWYWPAPERLTAPAPDERVRLLAPFDPVVWDRRRFELFWGFGYRFEAYTPAPRRRFGYYALPMLFGEHVVGWANLSWRGGQLESTFGYASGRAPRARSFARELEAELARVRTFLADAGGA